MNKKRGEELKRTRRGDEAGGAILALCVYSAAAAAVLLIFGKLIPSPSGEYLAIFYSARKLGRILLSDIFAFLFIAGTALCVLSSFIETRKKIFFIIPASLIVAGDLGVHAYAFLRSSGYQWNYLLSAALDAILLVCLFFRLKKRVADGEAPAAEAGT